MSTTKSNLPKYVAIILCVLAVHTAYKVHQELSKRTALQERAIGMRKSWNDQIEAIRPLEDRWVKTLPAASALSDQFRIVQHINAPALKLNLGNQEITVGDPANLSHSGRPIGLLLYPVSNNGGQNLSLTAPDFASAWQSLAQIQARPDVRFTRAKLENVNGTPTLSLEGFGLIARTETK
jgi:hypothetical protein